MKSALAFAATIGAVLAIPSELWSWTAAPSRNTDFVPIALADGSAVVTATDTGVHSFDQTKGTLLGTFLHDSTPEGHAALTASPVPGLSLFFPGDGTVVGLDGPSLDVRFTTSPALNSLDFCGCNERVMVLRGRGKRSMTAVVMFVDLKTGNTIKVLDGVDHARCAFLGSSVVAEALPQALALRIEKARTPEAKRSAAKKAGAIRFHQWQPYRKLARAAPEETAGPSAPTLNAVFLHDGAQVTRYDYFPSAAGSTLRAAWNATDPTVDRAAPMRLTPDQTVVVLGHATAIDAVSGGVRTIANAGKAKVLGTTMYRGAMALLQVRAAADVVVFDYASMSIVHTLTTRYRGCTWSPTDVVLQLLPKSGLILASTAGSCVVVFDGLTSNAPTAALHQGSKREMTFLDSTPGTVLAHTAILGNAVGSVRSYSLPTWRLEWSLPLPASPCGGAVTNVRGQVLFVDSCHAITAYAL